MGWWDRLLGRSTQKPRQTKAPRGRHGVVYNPPTPIHIQGSDNLVLSKLRDALHSPPGGHSWALICTWLEEAHTLECLDMALDYVREPLTRWDARLCTLPPRWFGRLRAGKMPPELLKVVRCVDLSHTDVGAGGISHLLKHPMMAGVEHLNLRNNNIHSTIAHHIAEGPPWQHLKTLDMACNRVDAPMAMELFDILELRGVFKTLEKLDLSSNNIAPPHTDRLQKHLGMVAPSLEVLLDGNGDPRQRPDGALHRIPSRALGQEFVRITAEHHQNGRHSMSTGMAIRYLTHAALPEERLYEVQTMLEVLHEGLEPQNDSKVLAVARMAARVFDDMSRETTPQPPKERQPSPQTLLDELQWIADHLGHRRRPRWTAYLALMDHLMAPDEAFQRESFGVFTIAALAALPPQRRNDYLSVLLEHHQSPFIRAQAARALALDRPEAVETLRGLLNEPDAGVHDALFFAIPRQPALKYPDTPTLLALLCEDALPWHRTQLLEDAMWRAQSPEEIWSWLAQHAQELAPSLLRHWIVQWLKNHTPQTLQNYEARLDELPAHLRQALKTALDDEWRRMPPP